jgi:hypothetical protein
MTRTTAVLMAAAVLVATPAVAVAEAEEAGRASQVVLASTAIAAARIGGQILLSAAIDVAVSTAWAKLVPCSAAMGSHEVGPTRARQVSALVSALGTRMTPQELSLGNSILIALAVTKVAMEMTGVTWEDITRTITRLAERFGSAVRWAAHEVSDVLRIGTNSDTRTPARETNDKAVNSSGDARLMTVIEFRRVQKPGDLVPNLNPMQETWKGHPIQ